MTYDIAIIGGGPGGYTCAEKAAKAGLKTVLFEKALLGGMGTNIPSVQHGSHLLTVTLCRGGQDYRMSPSSAP